MACKTLLLHLQLGQSNAALLKLAAGFSKRLQANVVGAAACQPLQLNYTDLYDAGNIVQMNRDQIDKELREAEAEFRGAFDRQTGGADWRSDVPISALATWLAEQARSADLVITEVDHENSVFDSTHHVNIGDLVLQLGRPLLIVPRGLDSFVPERVLVCWKNTREARRAIADALPLLKAATTVTVAALADETTISKLNRQVKDVLGWLAHHGVKAESIVAEALRDEAEQLRNIARKHTADLIVAGAYGHTRLREFVLGGVTRDLLLRGERCALVSN